MATQALDFQFGTLPVDDYEPLVAEPAQQVSKGSKPSHACCAVHRQLQSEQQKLI
jgi:hypothetical protein